MTPSDTMDRPAWIATAIRLGGWSLAYFLAQSLAFQFPRMFGLLVTIWPAAGIALASLLLSERRHWPVLIGCLFAAGLAANLTMGLPLITSVGFMIANMCETAACAWWIRRCCENSIRFSRVPEVVALAGCVFLINGTTAWIGAGTAHITLGKGFGSFYSDWWVADGLGLLLVTPLILVWMPPWKLMAGKRWPRILEALALWVLACTVASFVFGWGTVLADIRIQPYLIMVFIIWAAIRFGPRCTMTLLGAVALIAITCTCTGTSEFPLGGDDPSLRLLAVQVYLGILGLVGLLLAAAMTQQRESQRQLQAALATLQVSEAQYRELFDRANVGIFLVEGDGKLLSVNEAFARMHGYTEDEMRALHLKDLDTPESYQKMPGRMRRLQAGEALSFEVQHYHKEGHVFPLEVSASQITSGEDRFIQCFHHDITERKLLEEKARMNLAHARRSRRALLSAYEELKRAEEELQKSLHEKESLLKEIHHRVKNNLQIISSLLRLQANQLDDPVAKVPLLDMQNRIRSMALIHEHLYRSTNLADVDLSTYLKQLCIQLYRVLVLEPARIRLHLELAPIHLEIDHAIPCGLLVNELVSNAFKHAFPADRRGEVRVELQALTDGPGWRLRVTDNGVGLPPDFDMDHLTSLGLKLVNDLARQLGGRLTISAGPGAVFEVECR